LNQIIRFAGFGRLASDLQMDPALRKLLRLRFRARLRVMFRGLKTPRGAVFFAIGALMLVFWLGPTLVMAVVEVSARDRFDPEVVRAVIPLVLAGTCLLSVLGWGRQKGISFTAPEIDFLFAGPFTRRELLVYKLSGGAVGTIFVALFFSVFLLRYANLWIAAFVGCLLTLLFVQLCSTAVVLVGQTVAEHVYTRSRKLALLAVAALAGIGLGEAALAARGQDPLALLIGFRHSWAGIVLLAPVDVFGRTILAQSLLPELVGWGALAAAIDLALLALVLRLDVNYAESAIAASQRLYRRLEQVRRGGGLAWTAASQPKLRVAAFPWLGGAGPIVRRQLIGALRTARGLLFFLVVMGIPFGMMLVGTRQSHNAAMGALPGVLMFLTVFFTQMVPFDFRGDLDHIDLLKSLPLRSTAIAAGQLVVPTLIMTGVHLAVLGVAAAMVEGAGAVLLAMAVFSVPFNFLLIGLENLLFLLFPTRMQATTPGDLQHVGRLMVLLAAKMLALVACCGVAAALGGIAYLVGGGSWIAALSVSWLVLAIGCAALVPCVAAAYRKFDVSVDTPP